ncbi:MAG TPA: AAA family ATPase [Actinomycetota bacterium]|nr:AAA family ATPase [Actinomycetota bacterium]
MTQAVLLTGTIGVGKTTVAEAISESLHDAHQLHALIDLDWLAQLYPAPDEADPYNTNLAADNLAAVWRNFHTAGARRAVMAATVESAEQLGEIRRALPDAEFTVVLVTASSDSVHGRIATRDRGRLRNDFLACTNALATRIESAGLHEFAIENDGRLPDEAANEILQKLGWLP